MNVPDEPFLLPEMAEDSHEVRSETAGSVKRLVEGQPFAVLCTQGHGQPYGSLVAYAMAADLASAVFATPKATRKFRLLSECDHVALVIDSRPDFPEELMKIEAVTVSGKKLESSVELVYDISSANYYALVIAVENYDDPVVNDLDLPIDDATRFCELINKEYNFQKENITFMKNPTKAEIIGTLHNMRSIVTPEDNLLIYYAGHGYWDEEMSTGYWLPRDATRDNPVNWLPNTDLTNYLNVLKTKHTLLIADACFSGGIFKTRAAFNNVMSVEKLYKLTSRKAITSGTLSEVPDKSVFIEYLIKRLDENNRKYLPSEQLYSSLKEAVINNSPNIPQYGTIQNVGDEGGDFIFIRRD